MSTELLRDQSARASAAADSLWRAGSVRRAAWLGEAFAGLANPGAALFREAVARIPESAGLSPEMVRWALESALAPLNAAALSDFAASVPSPHTRAQRVPPGRLCVVLLAGNVFTAAARAIAFPLLFGLPVLAKAAAHDGAFAALLQRALREADPQLGAAFELTERASGERDALLFERADVVSVYGSDSTLRAVRAQLPATVGFIGHGHGLGAAYVDHGALQDEQQARAQAEALAFDVAAYDQRGCMSPLVAWIRPGAAIAPERFAELVFEALARLARTLPRGPLPLGAAGAQLNFRGVAALQGRLLEGDGFAVTYEEGGALRVSPGYRNLQLLSIQDPAALADKLGTLGVHLKCLGVAGVADLRGLLGALPARSAPRVCALGRMQTPALDALQDGVPAWEGLLRYAEQDA